MVYALRLLGLHAMFRGSRIGSRETPSKQIPAVLGRVRAARRSACFRATASEETLMGTLRQTVETAVLDKFPFYDKSIEVTECNNPSLGDYQSNSAMQVFSVLKQTGQTELNSPRDVASEIVSSLSNKDIFESISVAGPGFINFRLSNDFICSQLGKEEANHGAGSGSLGHVLVDFSSPNIAKEMHVGHLRSTIIGDTLCNIFEYCGYTTSRVNHVGDWGTQFGMLIQFMADNKKSLRSSVTDLQSYYKEAKQRFDIDEEFAKKSKALVVKLQSYEPETLRMWEEICEASRIEFQTIYDRLNVRIDEKGESFYNDMIPDVLDELLSKALIVEDAGALCIFESPDSAPVICRKSDGGFNYASTDLAAIHYRTTTENADRIIYVTDQGQQNHFKAIFKTALAAGWGGQGVSFEHVGFGVVLGEDGKRLRTRSGETVKLKSLLDEAEERCLRFLQEKGSRLPPEELEDAARILGISSVKYADLHNNRLTNYTFSFDRMLDLKGNTAMYLQYSHARVATVLRKAAEQGLVIEKRTINISNASERMLALQLIKLNDALQVTVKDLTPSRLCEYLYALCTVFNNFYAESKVLGGENEASRIYLCKQTAHTMKLTFSLLGMEPINRL